MKKIISCIAGFLFLSISGMSQVDNNVKFNVNFNDNYNDLSSYNLEPTIGNVLTGYGRFRSSITQQAGRFTGTVISNLSYGSPEHLKNDDEFSISIWYQGGTDKLNDSELLLSKFDLSISLEENNTPTVSGVVDEDWKLNAYNSSGKLFNKGYGYYNWHHLVVVKRNDSIFIYRGNKLRGSGKYIPSQLPSSDKVIIGKGFKGEIDHLTIYEGALSNAEISYLFISNQDLTVPPVNCPDSIFFLPVRATFNEGNTFSFCENLSGTFHISNKVGPYNLLSGLIYLEYPGGAKEIVSGSQFSLDEVGVYQLTFLTAENCMLKRSFEMLPVLEKPVLSFQKTAICRGTEDFIELEIPVGDISKNFNGKSNIISIELINGADIIGNYSAKDSRIPIAAGGFYRVNVRYEGCINRSLWSEDLIIDEEVCSPTSVDYVDKRSGVNIFPNPSNGLMFIENPEGLTDVTIVSAMGVKTKESVRGKMLDLSGYKQGVYSILIPMDKVVIRQRIVIE
ncbi:LamG-like jellyroll fold domain-containing protein [Sporocytophaga myxococcoides]|uniref:LamG-like jellyroll fold domain-containing protein n=1 Tax=Sporocytophaga myxococcoides TaxID=153721 RepID=UPI000400EEB0|nr:LamG-like jellyroll fold domain-containing protein [Sporocytophaga myxococcoides]